MKYKKLFMLVLMLQSYAYGSSNIARGPVAVGPNAIGMGSGSGMAPTNALTGPVENATAKTFSNPLESVILKLGSGGSYLAFVFDRAILNKIPSEVIQDGLYVSMNTSDVASWVGFTDTQEPTTARKLVANLTDKKGTIYAESTFYAAKNIPGYSGFWSGGNGEYYYNLSEQTVTFTDTQGNTQVVGPYQITSAKRAWFKSSNGVAPLNTGTVSGSTLSQLWFSPVFTQLGVGPYAELEITKTGSSSNLDKINTALASGPVRITATYDTKNKTYSMVGSQNGSQVFTQQGSLGSTSVVTGGTPSGTPGVNYSLSGGRVVSGTVPYDAPLAAFNLTIQTTSSLAKVLNFASVDGVELTSSGGNLVVQGVCDKMAESLGGTFASGETLSDVEIGFAFTGTGTGKSGDTMVTVPLTSTHLAFINSHLTAGKEALLDVSVNKGAAFYGMKATLSVPADPSVTPMTISQQPLVGSGSLSGGVSSTKYTLKNKGTSIGYKTNNQKGMRLYSNKQMPFKQRGNTVVVHVSGAGTPTTLVGKLKALGKNPSPSTVESTIKAYYKQNMTTIKNDWSTVSSDLSTAGLSSMTSSLKAIFDPAPPPPPHTGGGGGGGQGASGRF